MVRCQAERRFLTHWWYTLSDSFCYSLPWIVQDKKLTNLDEGAIKDIIGELEDDEAFDDKENTSDSIAVQKAKHRVQLRLAMEKKAAARKGGRKGGDDDEDNNNNDDDVADLTTFAKNASSGTTAMKSKKK